MANDKFLDERKHPEEAALGKRMGDAFPLLDDVVHSLAALHPDVSSEWKFSKTSGWYLTYNKKKIRLFYLFPLDGDFTLKIVFNDAALGQITADAFPKPVLAMKTEAKKYPEGTLFIFNKNNFQKDVMLKLLQIKTGK